MMQPVDKNAPIVPDGGLGGFELRRNIRDYEDSIGPYFWRGTLRLRLPDPFRALYTFRGFGIQVGVDVRNGKIFQIAASEGYEGTLFGQIRVGMTVADAMRIGPDLYWDEVEAEIRSRTQRGVFLDIGGDVPSHMVPQMKLESIVVYAPETRDTLAGASGDW